VKEDRHCRDQAQLHSSEEGSAMNRPPWGIVETVAAEVSVCEAIDL
jgi:hypothetical protein